MGAAAMSVLAAVGRSPCALRRLPAIRVAKRHLGETTVGPPVTDLGANLRIAGSMFTKSPVSYREFKQQCVSLRLFAFAGVSVGCALCLFLDPPKSSYWVRYSPSYWFANLRGTFGGSSRPLFLSEKVEYEANVP